MADRCTEPVDECAALAARDPETLVGPLLWLLTRLGRGEDDATRGGDLDRALAAQLTALAAHPDVALELRLAAGALAIEHRQRAGA